MWNKSKIKYVFSLPMIGLFCMGNTSCKQTSSTSSRQLKKLVEFKKIDAKPINLGSAGSFDFEWVVNNDMYPVLSKTDSFTFKYRQNAVTGNSNFSSSVASKATLDISQVNLGLKPADQAQLENLVISKTGSYVPPTFSTAAQCMVDLPQAYINGAINSFEMIGGGGINLGYTPAGSVSNVTGQLQLSIQKAQLDMTMNAIDPLSSYVIASTIVDQKQTSTKLNFLLNLFPLTAGFNYYYSTPLATVTKKALTKAVQNIAGVLNKQEWYTRVLYDLDPELAVIGGTNMGLQVGDQLAIYNDLYAWEGEPCNSNYIGGASTRPAVIVEVIGVGLELSYVKVIESTRVADPVVGAKVKLFKFASTATKTSSSSTTLPTSIQ